MGWGQGGAEFHEPSPIGRGASGFDLMQCMERIDHPATADSAAMDALFATFYDKLKRVAHGAIAANRQHLVNTTMLVHEAYLKLRHREDLRFASEAQFYAYAARVMRSVLLDSAKLRLRAKREGGSKHLSLDAVDVDALLIQSPLVRDAHDVIAIDAALEQLRADDARAAEVVELHHFAGLSFEQIAPLKALSVRTIKRDWEYARAFLYAALAADPPPG